MRKVLTLLSSMALLLSATGIAVAAPPSGGGGGDAANAPIEDNLSSPLADKKAAQHKLALEQVITGKATPKGKNQVVKLAPGQFVELARQGEDSILTILGEFGPLDHPAPILFSGVPGPIHNQIPEPDRAVDNSTIWTDDFSEAYYEDLLFSDDPGDVSMRNFYIEQSSNMYTVNGDVTDWVEVPYNAAAYGRNYCGSNVCAQTWVFVNHSIDAWWNAAIADGATPAELNSYLADYDVWDRYDHDGDGDFTEPDGYIDHFQSVHAGEGEETGGGAQGSDAIWSHRWYAYFSATGPDGVGPHSFGGVRIGASNYWIGDYTIEPENGGVGVFAHEFAHDLGLPDMYDVSGNTGGAENSTGFWTLMSSGSYGSTGNAEDGIGSKPISMSVYEKIFLGWTNYAVVDTHQKASLKLGPSISYTKAAQSLVVLLPDKFVDFEVDDPYSGTMMYFSGSGPGLDNTMTRDVTLGAGSTLSAKIRYDIETDWDYAYLTVNGDPVATNLSTNTDPNGQNDGEGITGSSHDAWVDLTADLSAFDGQTVTIGFRYWTDPFVNEAGVFLDDIQISGQPLDDAESDFGWTFDGFIHTDNIVTLPFLNYYFAEYRTYNGYDLGLKTGPYNFGFPDTAPNWVEHFPYQDGLTVWYYDESFPDNGVGDNCAAGRCGGLILPVDAHPDLLIRPDNGLVWRPRVQSYDSSFGTQKTDVICLHTDSETSDCYGGLPGNRVFDDTQSYWVAPDASIGHAGWSSVPLPGFGVKIRVVSMSPTFIQLEINK